MALLGNYTVLAKNPGRAFSGSTTSDNRSQSSTSGANRCRITGWASYSPFAAPPNGYLPPYSWVLPIDPGGMSSYTLIRGDSELSAAGALGRNVEALLDGSSSVAATAQLVVSAVATINGSSSVSANVVAILNAEATITNSSSTVGILIGDGFAVAALDGSSTVTLTSYATGTLEAEITPFSTLSPESLAASVWSAVTADNASVGSMGEALSFAQIVLRNKTVTDPTAGTVTVYDTDGTTVLYVADLFQDAAGLTAYAGAGAERRERLE